MKNTFQISNLINNFNLLQVQGVHLSDMIKGAGITNQNAMNPFYHINFEQQNIILNNISRLNSDPLYGFKVGMKKNPAYFGAPMQAVLCSVNFIESNMRASRLEHIYAPYSQIKVQPYIYKKGSYVSERKYLSELKYSKAIVTESSLAITKLAAEAMSGRKDIFKLIRLGYIKPNNHDTYEKFFQCPVEFNCEKTEFLLTPEIASQPSRLRNTRFAEYTERLSLSQEREKIILIDTEKEEEDFGNKVSQSITAHPKLYPNVDQVAESLCISPRTMHRKLQKAGTSFQKIMDNIKLSFAQRYILHTHLTIDEIAIETGFSSGNSFRVAFKSWTNLTPSAFRKQHKAAIHLEQPSYEPTH